jgi:hypothetical protein
LQRIAGTDSADGRKLSKPDAISADRNAGEPHLLMCGANQFRKESFLAWAQRLVRAFDLNKPEVKYTSLPITKSHKIVRMRVCLSVAVARAPMETPTCLLTTLLPKFQRSVVSS